MKNPKIPSGINYPFTLEKFRQTREISDYLKLLDLFDTEFVDSALNEEEEPDADEMLDMLCDDGWRIRDN